MADNTAQNGTSTIAADDVTTLNGGASSGVLVQRVKVMFGEDNSATDASKTNPLPINFWNTIGNQRIAETALNGDTTGPNIFGMDSSSFNQLFDGTNWNRARSVINALNSTGTGILAAGAVAQFDDTSPTSITENQFGNLRMSANRNAYVTIRDAAGNERGVNVTANNALTVEGPTLTKGTQGATGLTVQPLRDAGRVIVNAATAIAGVTAVTTEALVALNISRDGAATASATSHAVTSGKRWRITGLMVSGISTAAAVFSARVSLRMNPSGAATASSPIIATVGLTQQAAALAQAGDSAYMPFPDGIEVSGTMQVGVSQVANVVTGTLWVSLIGYEY